jgi:hypothetical protein
MGATTQSVMSVSKMTFSIKGLFATFSITTLCHYVDSHYAECLILFIVMLIVFIQSVVMVFVVMLNVIILTVAAPYKYIRL